MCGIAGFIDIESDCSKDVKRSLLKSMGDMIVHRGPDQGGAWVSDDGAVGFSHRRLSILDLSQAGAQPMQSHCGRYVIVYNGEVYNYKEIAASLSFDASNSSDTAVVLEAISRWGLNAAIKKMHGMFAFACYDVEEKTLFLARDRMGEKPLYVGCHEGRLLFGSELKALRPAYKRLPAIDRDALALYLRHGYYPAPYTVFKNIFKLPPATVLALPVNQIAEYFSSPIKLVEQAKKYWGLDASTEIGGDMASAKFDFETEFMQVVNREMRSDVPLGAFLSGGVDSSLIVAAMQSQSDVPVNTFSIGFDQAEYNEAPYAAAVAKHLGTNHREKILTANDALQLVPHLAKIYDEPFADSSQLPTLLVSQLAREHVTVSLSGDGGDELFGGYARYRWAISIWKKTEKLPKPIRQIAAALVKIVANGGQKISKTWLSEYLSKAERLAAMLTAEDRQLFYRVLISSQLNPQQYILGAGLEPEYTLSKKQLMNGEFMHQMMWLDIHTYLPDDILTKVDRASMAVSLETRVPLLDHKLVERAWGLRQHALETGLQSKNILRDILYKSVPRQLIERPKRGFAVPMVSWLRNELKPWADELLDYSKLEENAVFDAKKVRKIWTDFQAGGRGSERVIWSILVFQLWQEQWYR